MAHEMPLYLPYKEAVMATQTMRPPQSVAATRTASGDLPPAVIQSLEMVSLTNHYPTGTVLFSEGQGACGMYIVQRGRVKLSVCASDGRTLILRIVEAGE